MIVNARRRCPASRQRSPRALLILIEWLVLLTCAQGGRLSAEPVASDRSMLDDASLRSVAFIDPDRGWAVGDRGVIWRTSDGGRSWQWQKSGVSCELKHVFFVDQQHGWIVGGWTHPYTHHSTGVVLRTVDGGQSWLHQPGLILPNLERVRFFSPREGVALGSASPLFPAGIFRSTDGGRSWGTIASPEAHQFSAGDFLDMQRGALAGHTGTLASLVYDRLVPSPTPPVGPRGLNELRLQGLEGWLVGDGGLVMRTKDGGTSWRLPEGALPEGSDGFDFNAVSVHGTKCWVVGSPGSVVLHSEDGGAHWQRLVTGQSLPLHGITFLDERRGWAVGDLGVILGTRDGGKTWRRLRGGGERVALLAIFGEPQTTPWELLTWYCGNEGYLGAVELLGSRRSAHDVPTTSALRQRSREAVTSSGASAAHLAWNFPLPPAGLSASSQQVLAEWDQANDGRGRQDLVEHVVRIIRQWKPDVIVTEDVGGTALQREIAHVVLEAVEQAGEPTAFPEHAALAGLAPWQASKVFSRSLSESMTEGPSTSRLSTAQLATHLAASLDDYATTARGLVFPRFTSSPESINLRLLVNRLPGAIGQVDLFSGLRLQPGEGARRRPFEQQPTNLESLGRLVQQRRNIEQLITRSDDDRQGAAWLGQVEDLTRSFQPDTAGCVLYQLALHYQKRGQLELAADATHRLVSSYPEHELTDSALRWLVQYYTSSEVAWRLASTTRMQSQQIASRPDPRAAATAQAGGVIDLKEQPLVRAAFVDNATTAAASIDDRSRLPKVTELGALIARTRPPLYADPAVRFPLAAAQRSLGQARQAEQYLQQVAASAPSPMWRLSAQGELWLRHAVGLAPKPSILCVRANSRPYLDGQLDDPLWQSVQHVELETDRPTQQPWPSRMLLAYDQEFLYLAIECIRAPGCDYPGSVGVRTRDPDLTARDRLEIRLDVDRDYATAFRLVIDHRGWVAEDCWGDSTWNPQWFVASGDFDDRWTAEAAIAWSELVPQAPAPHAAWAMSVQRIAPEAGLQSWTWPAAVEPIPESMGLLLFE